MTRKGSIHQMIWDITIINIYAPSLRALKYMKQILTELKGNRQWHNNSRKLQYSTFNNGGLVRQTDKKIEDLTL